MSQSIFERFMWTLARDMVVEHDYTCYAPGALFEEPCVFKGTNNRGLLIRPIEAEGKNFTELTAVVEEGFQRTDEVTRGSGLRSTTIIHLFLFESTPSLTILNEIRSLERHQTYPDVSLYTAVYAIADNYFQMYVPFYAKRLLTRAILRKAAADVPAELNLSQLQSQMNQAGEKRRLEWGKLFVQNSSKGTYTFIAFCIVIFIWMWFTSSGNPDLPVLTKFGAKINPLLADGQYWRLLTPIFVHISLFHLLVNMIALYSLRTVEWMFGSYRFLFIFLVAGIGGNTASFALSMNPSAGASGAIFGLLGALLYFGWEKTALFRRAFSSSIWVTLGMNLILGLSLNFVDNWAHLGGLIAGFLASILVGFPGDEKITWKKSVAAFVIVGLLFGGISYGVVKTRGSEQYHLYYANAAHNSYNTQQEIEELLKALAINPQDVQVLLRLGQLEADLHQPETANSYLQRAVQTDPHNPLVHYQLGIFYESQDMGVQAAQEYENALEINPNFVEARMRLSHLKTK